MRHPSMSGALSRERDRIYFVRAGIEWYFMILSSAYCVSHDAFRNYSRVYVDQRGGGMVQATLFCRSDELAVAFSGCNMPPQTCCKRDPFSHH